MNDPERIGEFVLEVKGAPLSAREHWLLRALLENEPNYFRREGRVKFDIERDLWCRWWIEEDARGKVIRVEREQ